MQVAYKLLELYIKLRELGHCQYIEGDFAGPPLSCGSDLHIAEKRVNDMEDELTNWKQSVTKLHSENSWLLFFRIPKLLKLYQLISGNLEDKETKIVHEVSFLCLNTVDERMKLKRKVEVRSYFMFI